MSSVIFFKTRDRWYTNEEVAAILTNYSSHPEWQTNELQERPRSETVLLYSREKVRYRQDGYCWKKRKNGRTTREDHMKLKVQGIECIYGCYVHSAILPTFHRRCYWLLQNPDIVLVHYLNQLSENEPNKMIDLLFDLQVLENDTRRAWTNQEIIEEIGAVFGGINQIHKTININFSSTATKTTSALDDDQTTAAGQQQEESHDIRQKNQVLCGPESSNQSEQSSTQISTSSPNVALEQVDMTIMDGRQIVEQQQHNSTTPQQFGIRGEVRELLGPTDKAAAADDDDDEIMMTTIKEEINNNNLQDIQQQQQQQHQQQQESVQQMEQQNCCLSPVTQIYNKIVDDIESYALPLEPDQFVVGVGSNHHHHQQQHNLSTMPIHAPTCINMNVNDAHNSCHCLVQDHDNNHHHHHHQAGQTLYSNDTGEIIRDLSTCSMDLTGCDLFGDGGQHGGGGGSSSRNDSICSHQNDHNQIDERQGGENDDGDGLLLNNFDITSSSSSNRTNQVGVGETGDDDLNPSVVETLSNIDDLKDLMLGISSISETNDHHHHHLNQPNLLVDTNCSLDLFNFKPLDCGQALQQLDVKSSTSDTDALTRLSPMTSCPVPRCNSTGNAFRSSSSLQSHQQQNNQQQQQQQQHLSNNYLSFSSMRLPLQQRQRSEQQEPCNSVLSSLLPKALSLDGSQSRFEVSKSIPMDNPSEILTEDHNNNNYHTTIPATTTQLQQQNILANLLDRNNSSSSLSSSVNNGGLLPILDYVPNWCNIIGGAKVLIVGNWSSLFLLDNNFGMINLEQQQSTNLDKDCSKAFFAAFDDLLVPATLIQDNILRCYAPSHEQGFISLKVIYSNRVVSEQVLFEMRPSCVQSSLLQVSPNSIHSDNNNNNNNNNNQNQNNCSGNKDHHSSSSSENNSGNNNTRLLSTSTPGNSLSTESNNSTTSNSNKVLTLAENIISAMHKKNNFNRQHHQQQHHNQNNSRLVNSLDIESLDHYRNSFRQNSMTSTAYQRPRSLKGALRRLIGSRSLSRDSEPCGNSYAMNFSFVDQNDPYWHQGPSTTMIHQYNNYHSHPHQQQQQQQQQQQPQHLPQPLEYQNYNNLTETSSSGLGSIVSSLSPSPSSSYSPTSVCNAIITNRHSLHQSGLSNLGDITSSQPAASCSCEGNQLIGTPTSADFCEYFQASAKTQECFASLTLSDHEQQELYEAAKIIQKAYRTYRGRKRQASELLVEVAAGSSGSGGVSASGSKSSISSSSNQTTNVSSSNDYQASGSVIGKPGVTANNSTLSQMLNMTPQQQVEESQQQMRLNNFTSSLGTNNSNSNFVQQPAAVGYNLQQQQQQQSAPLVKCYRDREMQAATIIQAYYRRYRQYAHFKRQQKQQNNSQDNKSKSTNSSTLQQQQQQQQQQNSIVLQNNVIVGSCDGLSYRQPSGQQQQQAARLVVDTMPLIINKATTSHVDRKRFKTAILISSSKSVNEDSSPVTALELMMNNNSGNNNTIDPASSSATNKKQ